MFYITTCILYLKARKLLGGHFQGYSPVCNVTIFIITPGTFEMPPQHTDFSGEISTIVQGCIHSS